VDLIFFSKSRVEKNTEREELEANVGWQNCLNRSSRVVESWRVIEREEIKYNKKESQGSFVLFDVSFHANHF
jgi:hypothetical protein